MNGQDRQTGTVLSEKEKLAARLAAFLKLPFPVLENGQIPFADGEGFRIGTIIELRQMAVITSALSRTQGLSDVMRFIDLEITAGKVIFVSKAEAGKLDLRTRPTSDLRNLSAAKVAKHFPPEVKKAKRDRMRRVA